MVVVMASETFHCPDCGLYFDSAQSLDVHLQYHKENLMNMWMGTEEIKREAPSDHGGAVANAQTTSNSSTITNGMNDSVYVKSEPKESSEADSHPSFIGPPPISPMDYEFKVEPSLHSPRNNLISPGPTSGSTFPYSQTSTSPFYADYNSASMMPQTQQHAFQNFPTTYDDQYYNRGPNPPRFHPYIGRSPVPTPSPGTGVEVKDERLTPSTPEILDLDSQKVLNGNQLGSLPSMWRPHEHFPSTSSSNPLPHSGISGSSSPIIGIGNSSTSNVKSLVPPLGHSPGNPGLPSNMPMSSIGPQRQISMPPPSMQQQHFGNQSSMGSLSSVGGFSSTNPMPSFFPQSLPVSSSVPTGSGNGTGPPFSSSQTLSPSSREVPPSEYPSNVKRSKSFKCEDCNKWFTSHGHLKRHYNTTLHKNMTKLNSSNPASTNPGAAQDTSRTPIVSPNSSSIGDSSNNSSHEEEATIVTPKPMDSSSMSFPPTPSAFQPPNNVTNFPHQNVVYTNHNSMPLVHQHPVPLPQYSQAHSFTPDQPLTAPTMYHGHFSTNPASYGAQPHPTNGGPPYFLGNNYFYPQQGGLHGPGFHSVNEYSGPNPTEGFTFRPESADANSPLSNGVDTRVSPEPLGGGGDTGSEASMDSSESCASQPVESNYKCNDCNKTFNRMCYLTQHRSTYHEGEKPFKCGTCGKRFLDETTFTDHQGKHAGEKPYKCEVCPKQFNHKTDLRRHMCLHTGEKPFSCEQCGKGFIRKDHMLKHFQTHRKKALAAASQAAVPAHPHLPPAHPGFTHHSLPPPHAPLPHPPHGPRSHPHVVAPTVY